MKPRLTVEVMRGLGRLRSLADAELDCNSDLSPKEQREMRRAIEWIDAMAEHRREASK
jgi:hypothetical protein